MNAIIETKQLTHIYSAGTPFERGALLEVDFSAMEGEYLGIIGHTGSGKSTLIQHLNGLLAPTSGEILLSGRNIWAEPKKIRSVRFRVGLVFQYPEYQLFEETVYKDIAFGPSNMGKTGAELDRCGRESAKLVGLGEGADDLAPFDPDRPDLPADVAEQVEISVKYEGYIRRQEKQVEEFQREESRLLPEGIDYMQLEGLRVEARQKLSEIRPLSVGQASRISGVSPSDIAVLLIWLQQHK